jgi:integrase
MGGGSIRQRGRDSWQLRVYLGADPETRRQRWASRTVHGSRRFAQSQLGELVEEARYAHLRAGTLADLLDRWFQAASPGWALTTVSHTRSVIDCYLKPHLGHLHVAKVTTEDIDAFYGHLLRAGGRNDRPLAPGSVARVHGVLHRALAQAVRWEWIWLNPASNACPPRVPPAEIRPPSPKQVATLLEAVRKDDPPLFCFLRLAASTGARRGQLLALRWHAIDWEGGAIAFTRALVQGPHGPELRPTKTHRTHRTDLDGGTLAVLEEHRARVEVWARKMGMAALPPSAFLFSSEPDGSRPWRPNWVTKRFIASRRAAGLAPFRLHDLRHFVATEMLAAGVPIVTVAQRLNHARVSTTLNVYAHAIPGGDRFAAETVASMLDGSARSLPSAFRRSTSTSNRERDQGPSSATTGQIGSFRRIGKVK